MDRDPSKPEIHTRTTNSSQPEASANAAINRTPRDRPPPRLSSYPNPSAHRPTDSMGQSFGGNRVPTRSSVEQNGWAKPPELRQSRDLESQNRHLRRTLELKEREYRAKLEEKESELAELKKTLCMYDECSEVEISNMVDGINTRIQSLARNLAVKWVKEAPKTLDAGEIDNMASQTELDELGGAVGTHLANALGAGRTQFTAVFLQLAWQASIVGVVEKILSSFSASLVGPEESQIENTLREISEAVKAGEVQPAFGRWRMVTHRYLEQVKSSEGAAVPVYVEEALKLCRTACRLVMKSSCPDGESFRNSFHLQTTEIVEEAFKLLTTIQEKMVTTNYEPYILKKGRSFDPGKMNVDKQDGQYQNDHVVCTTGVGMLYSRRKGREKTSEPVYNYIFKKPQVLTECNLSDMIAG